MFIVARPIFDFLLQLGLDRDEKGLFMGFLEPILLNFYENLGWAGKEGDYGIGFLR